MKIIKILLKILLPILLILITTSFAIENMITKTISNDILSQQISEYFLDNIINDFDIDELEKIQNEIKTSKNTEKITSKYIDILINNLIDDENQKIDITNEINSIIENELTDKISEEEKNKIINYIDEQSVVLENKIENNVMIEFNNDNYTFLFEIYNIYTSMIFRVIILLLLVLDLILLIVLEKSKSLKSIQTGIFITLIFSLICIILIKICSNYIEQRLSGGWINNININMLITFTLIEAIITLIIFCIRKISSKNCKIE